MPEKPDADRSDLERLYFRLMRKLLPPPVTAAEVHRALEMFRDWTRRRLGR